MGRLRRLPLPTVPFSLSAKDLRRLLRGKFWRHNLAHRRIGTSWACLRSSARRQQAVPPPAGRHDHRRGHQDRVEAETIQTGAQAKLFQRGPLQDRAVPFQRSGDDAARHRPARYATNAAPRRRWSFPPRERRASRGKTPAARAAAAAGGGSADCAANAALIRLTVIRGQTERILPIMLGSP